MQYAHDNDYLKKEKAPVRNFTLPPMNYKLLESMRIYLESRGLRHDVAMSNGWYPSMIRGEARVVIRSTSKRYPELNFWQARSMVDASELRYDSPKGNRADALGIVRGASSHRFCLVVTEGPMDALAAAAIPGMDGVCTFGKNPSALQLEHLSHLTQQYSFVILVPDSDSPEFVGIIINALSYHPHVDVLMLEQFKDLASVPSDKREDLMNAIVSSNVVDDGTTFAKGEVNTW